jgi:hypothetical protein
MAGASAAPRMLRFMVYLPELLAGRRFFLKLDSESESFASSFLSRALTTGVAWVDLGLVAILGYEESCEIAEVFDMTDRLLKRLVIGGRLGST